MTKKAVSRFNSSALKQVYLLLPERSRKQFWLLLSSILFLAVVDGYRWTDRLFAAAISDSLSTIQTDFIDYARVLPAERFFSDPKSMISGTLAIIVVLGQ
ncbi:MAG: hypothetical protein R2864_10320 [Syntrophotaleaceae bacterium]